MIERATLTLLALGDDASERSRLVWWPRPNEPLDLLAGEPNVIASTDGRVRIDGLSLSQRLDVHVRDDAWHVTVSGARSFLDDTELAVGARVPLAPGAVLSFPDMSVALRFDHVRERVFARRRRVGDLVLLDCGGGLAPGRWRCLHRTQGHVVRGLAVAGPEGTASNADDLAERTEAFDREVFLSRGSDELVPAMATSFTESGLRWRVFDDVTGVPMRLISRRGRGLDPALAVHYAARVARWLHDTHAPLAFGVTSFGITWEGELAFLPSLAPRPSRTDGRGVIVELFVAMFPEESEWFMEPDPASTSARTMWLRLVEPFLAAFNVRDDERPELDTLADAMNAFEALVPRVRAIEPGEVRDMVRGMFPDEWHREHELREEIALLDAEALHRLLS